jgi:beta-lactamase class A
MAWRQWIGLSARLRGIAVTVILAAVVVRRRLRRKQKTSQPRLGVRRFGDRESAEATLAMTAGDVSGSVGFSSWHVESGRSLGINDDQRFPMASLVKLSVAPQTFRRIDAGTAHLGDVVELARAPRQGWPTPYDGAGA